jgi:hypothetical protein
MDKDSKTRREDLLQTILTHPEFIFEQKVSSIGRLKYKDSIIVYIKPPKGMGRGNSGKENESIVINNINQYISTSSTPLKVQFYSNNKSVTYNNVSLCVDSSKLGVKGYDKSDIKLLDTKQKVIANISIKQEGGFRWESSKTRYKTVFTNFIEKAKKSLGNNNHHL